MNTAPVPLFVNPTAGRGRAGRKIESISDLLESFGVKHRVAKSNAIGHLESMVTDAVSAGERRILVAGGDGSIHEVINGILRTREAVELGVIPVGTGNDFAKACAIPTDWQDAVPRLAERIAKNLPSRPVDAGRMNDRFFANGAGIGFDAEVTRLARDIRWRIGHLVYLVAVMKGIIDGVATPQISMQYSGRTFDGPITLVNFSNGAWIGGMFHIAPMARNDDGRLDLVFAEAISRLRIMALLPRLLRGSHIGQPDITHARVSRCRVIASAPLCSHLDGEVQPLQSRFEIEVLEGALRLL